MISTLDRLSGYNPLRGLDLEKLVTMIEQGERGYYADLQWLYRLVLRRNATARAVRRKLQGSLGKLDWDIRLRDDAAGYDKTIAERQQKTLRTAYENVRNLRRAWVSLAMADILEFSALCKVYAGAPGADPALQNLPRDLDPWAVVELRTVPRWHLCREGLFQPWTYNAAAQQINRGAPIDREHWIIRDVDDPAAEVFAFSHVKMSVSDADWDQFCDTYAVPPIFIEGPPNVAKDKESLYQATAEAIVSDGRGYLPNGAKVHTVTAGTNDGSAFTARLRYYREEIVLAGTGGVLTTLDGNAGIGKGPAEEHDATWLDIAAEIGASVTATLNEQFDDPLLDRLHQDEPHFAYFELQKPVKDASPAIVLQAAKAAKAAGYAIDAAELSEKSGFKLTTAQPSVDTETAGAAETQQASSAAQPAVDGIAKPPEIAASPAAPGPTLPEDGDLTERVRPARDTRTSRSGDAKPSLVQAALAEAIDVDARTFAPVQPLLDAIERLVLSGATPDVIAEQIEATIAALPEVLGRLDVQAFADAIEKATGPAALQGLRDALATQPPTRA